MSRVPRRRPVADRSAATVRAASAATAVAALFAAWPASAGLSFLSGSSSLTLYMDRDVATADALYIRTPSPVPAASAIYPVNPYQLQKNLSAGATSPGLAKAAGSLGHVTNATTGSFLLATGTGIGQDDPANRLIGASSLLIDTDLRWSVTSGGFGPVATGYASITAGGVVGAGGSAEVHISLRFLDGNNNALRSQWIVDRVYSEPGPFVETFTTGDVLAAGILAAGTTFKVRGTIEFRASNEDAPSKILPLAMEFGAAPPTATFANLGDSAWSDVKSWVDPRGQGAGLLQVPNGVGHRARFVGGNDFQFVLVDQPITVGTLDIDTDGGTLFATQRLIDGEGGGPSTRQGGGIGAAGEGPGITFETLEGTSAVLSFRNVSFANPNLEIGPPASLEPAGSTFDTPVDLVSDLDVNQSAIAPLRLAGPVSGRGGITKLDLGTLALSAEENTYAGGTRVLRGGLEADAPGTLGTGAVTVAGGFLGYNANGATRHPDGVVVLANGLVILGVVPGALDKFDIRGFGGVQGDGQEFANLRLGENLLLAEDAMIVHEAGAVGDPAGLGNTPKYIYGIAGAFPDLSITTGLDSDSPWKGFGAGAGFNSIGTATSGNLDFKGSALLVVLGDGILHVNAPVGGDGPPGSDLRKVGSGVAALHNVNPYPLPVHVGEGTLIVNGSLAGPSVEVAGGAQLGGVGRIDGKVQLLPGDELTGGARLTPGTLVGLLDDPFRVVPVGELTVGTLALAADSQLDFDFGPPGLNDHVNILGDLVLDGVLNIQEMDEFGPGLYTLMTFAGDVEDLGLEIGVAPAIYLYKIEILGPAGAAPFGIGAAGVGGGRVVLNVANVPEPGALALGALAVGLGLLRRRARQR